MLNTETEQLYTDFGFIFEHESNVSDNPSSEQSQQWGVHAFKPVAQTDWDRNVAEATNQIIDSFPLITQEEKWSTVAATTAKTDIRPWLWDPVLKTHILIDTGAAISVIPKTYYPNARLDTRVVLKAVNQQKLTTYGKDTLSIKIGRKNYNHTVIISDVETPIMGFDFIKRFKLDLVWSRWGDYQIFDKRAKIRKNLEFDIVPKGTLLNLAPIETEVPYKNYKQWSQIQTQKANEKTAENKIPRKYRELLNKFPEILKPDFKLTEPKHGIIHTIETGSNTPCTAKMRPLMPGSPKALQGEKNWRELETLGITERVNPSECNTWTSALNLVPKPDGSLRATGDYRLLNNKTLLDGYPLPSLKNFSAKIRGAKVFSRVDLIKAFHQIPLDKESKKKSTVITPWGCWQFKRLPMGLRNSAQSFQRMMDHILKDIPDIFIYMDDILVYSKDQQSHMKTLETVFKKLQDASLALSLDKCQFGEKEIDFVGYRVTTNGITPLQRKMDAIVQFPPPEKQKQLLGFLGAINYY